MGAFLNLMGQKFGKWTVIGESEERIRSSAAWTCRCECGVIKLVNSGSLRQGKTTSCGKGSCKKVFIDLTGKKIGKWTVIKPLKERRGRDRIWLCVCDCGNTKNVSGEGLRKGKTKSCGKAVCHSKFISIDGKKFGKLTVIKISEKRMNGEISWECKCECGNNVEVKRENLRKNSNCGRRQCSPTYTDLSGKVFGRLTAIKYTHTKINDYWDFKCSCDKIVNVLGHNVTKGHTKSCGCEKRKNEHYSILKSAYRNHIRGLERGEENIENFLSMEEYVSIASKACHYCGDFDIRVNRQTGATLKLNGVDRKNNERFYKIENSLPCCRMHNSMKWDTPYSEFLLSIRKLYEYTKNINLDQEANKESGL